MIEIPPNSSEKLALLRANLRIGLMINFEMGSFAAIEHLSAERYRKLQEQGDIHVVLSAQRALDLQLSHDPSCDGVFRLPRNYRFDLLKALADPSMDLDYPGKGPLALGRLSEENRARLLQFCRQARTLPAVVYVENAVEGSPYIDEPLWALVEHSEPEIEPVSHAKVPLALAPNSQLHVFREIGSDLEHYAVIIGQVLEDTPLVRLHSACFTGDCLGSLKCDCGPQLNGALRQLNHAGGVLLYLSQEGRGIGLPNKIRAYSLQDQGFDTVEANLKLGFQDDERDFRIGAKILDRLMVKQVRLMTNNPRKIEWLERSGIFVKERVPLLITPQSENRAYLATKARKSGHLL